MEIIYLLLPLSLVLVVLALFAFIWATRSGQFEDLDTPSQRILFDDPIERDKAESEVE